MPQPTRAEFDAAAKRVMESAPPGLSKEQFYDLIDKEIARGPINTKAVGGDTINGRDPNAPPSFLSRVASNPLLEGAAHPQSAGDFLSLIIPSGMGEAVSGIRDFKNVVKQGVQDAPSMKQIPGSILRTIRERPKTLQDWQSHGFNELPLAEQMRNLPEVPAPPVRPMAEPLPKIGMPPPIEQKPLYQQVEELPRQSPARVRGGGPIPSGRESALPPNPASAPRIAGKAPTLEDELAKAIEEAGSQPESGTMESLADDIGPAGEGPLKQSGRFPKKGQLGEAGGYSSGRPPVTPDQYDELITTPSNVPGRGVGAPEIQPAAVSGGRVSAPDAPVSAAPPATVAAPPSGVAPAATSDLTSQVLQSLGETETVPGSQLSSQIERGQPLSPQQIEDARRYLGSRDASKHLGLDPEQVLQAAPGPSQRPLLLDDLQGGANRSELIDQFLNDLLGR